MPQGLQIMADQGFEHRLPVIVLPRANQPQIAKIMRRFALMTKFTIRAFGITVYVAIVTELYCDNFIPGVLNLDVVWLNTVLIFSKIVILLLGLDISIVEDGMVLSYVI